MEDTPNDASTRSRKRKNVIGSSPNREEYDRLLQNGWSSIAVSRFALFRHGEDIPDRTIRLYRKRKGWDVLKSDMQGKDVDPDVIIDILAERSELIRLQKNRIGIDTAHERTMNKLFSGTRHEVLALSQLIDRAKEDMQDFGLFPKLGEIHNVTVHGAVQGLTGDSGSKDNGAGDRYAPPAQTLGALFNEISPEVEQQMARMLHSVLPSTDPHTNGAGVVEGGVEADDAAGA